MSGYVQPVIGAFLKGKDKKIGNTESRGNSLYLFGNRIAWIDLQGNLWITNTGWFTKTTKDRLNMLPGVHVATKNKRWYLNHSDVEWDGSPYKIGAI